MGNAWEMLGHCRFENSSWVVVTRLSEPQQLQEPQFHGLLSTKIGLQPPRLPAVRLYLEHDEDALLAQATLLACSEDGY